MANDLNQCNFIGRLGKDPEVRYMASGDAVCNFDIAVGWKTKDKEGAEWVRISVFGKLAEICGKYLKRGSKVFISGRFTTRKWQDQNGNDRYSTEIRCETMQMLDSLQASDSQANNPPQRQAANTGYAPQQYQAQDDEFEDEIPFN